jgi:hypothetical protein
MTFHPMTSHSMVFHPMIQTIFHFDRVGIYPESYRGEGFPAADQLAMGKVFAWTSRRIWRDSHDNERAETTV